MTALAGSACAACGLIPGRPAGRPPACAAGARAHLHLLLHGDVLADLRLKVGQRRVVQLPVRPRRALGRQEALRACASVTSYPNPHVLSQP